MTAFLIVRAQVVYRAVREDFDRRYQDKHLRDCVNAFGAQRAWRGWSEMDASAHYAVYEFEDPALARAIPGSDALKRKWNSSTVRGAAR